MEGRDLARLETKIENITKTVDRHETKISELSETYSLFVKLEQQIDNFNDKMDSVEGKIDNTHEIMQNDKENTELLINQMIKGKSTEQIIKEWLIPISITAMLTIVGGYIIKIL